MELASIPTEGRWGKAVQKRRRRSLRRWLQPRDDCETEMVQASGNSTSRRPYDHIVERVVKFYRVMLALLAGSYCGPACAVQS